LEECGQMDVIYTDIENAFDEVPHDRLLEKLKSYKNNSDIIEWIRSFWIPPNTSSTKIN